MMRVSRNNPMIRRIATLGKIPAKKAITLSHSRDIYHGNRYLPRNPGHVTMLDMTTWKVYETLAEIPGYIPGNNYIRFSPGLVVVLNGEVWMCRLDYDAFIASLPTYPAELKSQILTIAGIKHSSHRKNDLALLGIPTDELIAGGYLQSKGSLISFTSLGRDVYESIG